MHGGKDWIMLHALMIGLPIIAIIIAMFFTAFISYPGITRIISLVGVIAAIVTIFRKKRKAAGENNVNGNNEK